MPVKGLLSHLDISVGYPARSIPFYHVFLTALGFRRTEGFTSEFAGANPTRAGWRVETAGGATFGIELRPSRPEDRDLRYDRYKPGPHHIAFHAESVEQVDQVHAAMLDVGTEVSDAPADYSGQPGYGRGYYAAWRLPIVPVLAPGDAGAVASRSLRQSMDMRAACAIGCVDGDAP